MLVIVLLHKPFHDSLLHNIARGHLHSIECSRMYTWSSTIKKVVASHSMYVSVSSSSCQAANSQLDRRDHDSRTQPAIVGAARLQLCRPTSMSLFKISPPLRCDQTGLGLNQTNAPNHASHYHSTAAKSQSCPSQEHSRHST